MVIENTFEIQEQSNTLLIKSDFFRKNSINYNQSGPNWIAYAIDNNRLIIQHAPIKQQMVTDTDTAMAWTSIEIFTHILKGLNKQGWSGYISVDLGEYGIKGLYLSNGEICFAKSNMIDDRLGEVIYRAGLISLDKMTDYATRVTRSKKFGQVLLETQTFSTIDLWEALKQQIKDIIRSIFLVSHLYYEIKSGVGLAPTEILFNEGTSNLIEEFYSFGAMTHGFISRLKPTFSIEITNDEEILQKCPPGSFLGDFIEIIKENPKVDFVLNTSKLSKPNTYIALMNLVNMGICKITEFNLQNVPTYTDSLSILKSKIDAYSILLKEALGIFSANNILFPYKDLKYFALSLNPQGFISIYLDEYGYIDKNCIINMYSQCKNNPERIKFFTLRLDALIKFIVQISNDLLPKDVSKHIKETYISIYT